MEAVCVILNMNEEATTVYFILQWTTYFFKRTATKKLEGIIPSYLHGPASHVMNYYSHWIFCGNSSIVGCRCTKYIFVYAIIVDECCHQMGFCYCGNWNSPVWAASELYVKCDLAQLKLRCLLGFHLSLSHAAGQIEALFGCLSRLIPPFLPVYLFFSCEDRHTIVWAAGILEDKHWLA